MKRNVALLCSNTGSRVFMKPGARFNNRLGNKPARHMAKGKKKRFYESTQLADLPAREDTDESRYEDAIMSDKTVEKDVFPSLYSNHLSSLDLYDKTLKAKMGYGVGSYLLDMHHKRIETTRLRYDLVFKNESSSDVPENLRKVADCLKEKWSTNSFKHIPVHKRKQALRFFIYPAARALKVKQDTGKFTIAPSKVDLLPDRIIKRKDNELYAKDGKYNSRLTKGTFLAIRDAVVNKTPIRARLVEYNSKRSSFDINIGNILRKLQLRDFRPPRQTTPSSTAEEEVIRKGGKLIKTEDLTKVLNEQLLYGQINVMTVCSDRIVKKLSSPLNSFEELEETLLEKNVQFKLEAYIKEDLSLLPEPLKEAFLKAAGPELSEDKTKPE